MQNDITNLAKLQDYYAKHWTIPSYSTLGELWGVRAKSWVAKLVKELSEQGYLEMTPEKRLKPGAKFFERPMVGNVRAGLPSAAGDMPHEAITIDSFLIDKPSNTVLIKVRGDSMIDEGIRDGDFVVTEKRHTANLGDVVVAIVDNEFTVKYLAKDKSGYFLKAANPAFAPIRAKGQLEIFGVVIGMFRRNR